SFVVGLNCCTGVARVTTTISFDDVVMGPRSMELQAREFGGVRKRTMKFENRED
ncbi:hypothetical protein L195_g006070, partial [Trifolium pratense]